MDTLLKQFMDQLLQYVGSDSLTGAALPLLKLPFDFLPIAFIKLAFGEIFSLHCVIFTIYTLNYLKCL